MLGILFYLAFLAMGVLLMWRVLSEQSPVIRVWAGLVSGMIFMMFGVVPFAMFMGFTPMANLSSFVLAWMITAYVWMKKKPELQVQKLSRKTIIQLVIASSPLVVLFGILLNTHVFLPYPDGSIWVGQSTFGDLSLHGGIASGVATQKFFPPEYTIMAGAKINYPFLADTMSSTMIQLGTSLRWALLLPQFVMGLCTFVGFFIFANEILRRPKRATLAVAMFFLCGGLGFAYIFDLIAKPENHDAIKTVMEGFYKTPTNMPDLGLRWVNVIVDMMIPQRTLLFGWGMLFFSLWLFYRALTIGKTRDYVLTAIVVGCMPMVHTHSFLAFCMIAVVWLCLYFPRKKMFMQEPLNDGRDEPTVLANAWSSQSTESAWKIAQKAYIRNWIILAAIAMVLALPQLLGWTFKQTTEGKGFLTFFFQKGFSTWNQHDNWLWFWIKNMGVMFVALPLAYISARPRVRKAAWGGLLIFVAAELILFQPNNYDNNKLYYIWYALGCIAVADFFSEIYQRMAGMWARYVLAVIIIIVVTLSGLMSISREVVSKYQLFDSQSVKMAAIIQKETLPDGVFLTAGSHNDPVSTLAGRKIYVGSGSFLFFHGMAYQDRERQAADYFNNPSLLKSNASKAGIDYLLLGPFERPKYGNVNYASVLTVAVQGDGFTVYAVSQRAKEYHAKN